MVTGRPLPLVRGRRKDLKLLATLVNPASQLNKVVQRQLLDRLLDFLNLAHAGKITSLRRKTSLHYRAFPHRLNARGRRKRDANRAVAPFGGVYPVSASTLLSIKDLTLVVGVRADGRERQRAVRKAVRTGYP